MSLRDFYDLKYINRSGGTIPAYAVIQVDGAEDVGGLSFLKAIKPTAAGTVFILNGPRACENGQPSSATSALAHLGAFALFDDAETPAKNEEWGPESGSWYLKKGNAGFYVIGDIKGSAASQPGFPSTPSTKRVRVSGAGGGGGGVSLGVRGLIATTIGAMHDFDSSSTTIDAGIAYDAVILYDLIVNQVPGGGVVFQYVMRTTEDENGDPIPVTAHGINMTRSAIRGSSSVPQMFPGNYIEIEDTKIFEIVTFDHCSMVGFEKGSHSPEAPFMQIPFHLGGTYEFGLGGQPCPPPEIEVE